MADPPSPGSFALMQAKVEWLEKELEKKTQPPVANEKVLAVEAQFKTLCAKYTALWVASEPRC